VAENCLSYKRLELQGFAGRVSADSSFPGSFQKFMRESQLESPDSGSCAHRGIIKPAVLHEGTKMKSSGNTPVAIAGGSSSQDPRGI
jgi:hypothetical protein